MKNQHKYPNPVLSLIAILLLTGLGLSSCDQPSSARSAEKTEHPVDSQGMDKFLSPSESDPEPAPEVVEEVRDVKWESPTGPLSKTEQSYVGTWAGEVSEMNIRTGGVAFTLGGSSGGGDLVENIMEAMENDNMIKDHCTWLELYDDRTGLWAGCMMMEGGPTVYNTVDPFTGEEKVPGLRFKWYVQGKDIRIKFSDKLRMTKVLESGETEEKRVSYWDLKVLSSKTVAGDKVYTTQDHFPELDYTLPIKNEYSYFEAYLMGPDEPISRPMM